MRDVRGAFAHVFPCPPSLFECPQRKIIMTRRSFWCFIQSNETQAHSRFSRKARPAAPGSHADCSRHFAATNHSPCSRLSEVPSRRGTSGLGADDNLPRGKNATVQHSLRAARSGPEVGAELPTSERGVGSDQRIESRAAAAQSVGFC